MSESGIQMEGPAGSSIFEVDWGSLSFESIGKGSPIVSIYAAIASSLMRGHEVNLFSKDNQVVGFGMRG